MWTTDYGLIPVRRQDNYLSDRQFSSSRLTPVTIQEKYMWTNVSGLIPFTSHENYLHEEIED